MKSPWPLRLRLAVGAAFPLAVLGAGLYVRSGGTAIRCLFYELTGLYCPGCGSTRAIRALCSGRLRQALSWNPLLVLLGIPALGVVIYEYLRVVFPRLGLRPVLLPPLLDRILAAVILAFWVLRNIPAFSFLAPG